MTTPKDNTEVVRMLKDVKDSIWKSITPMKDVDQNFQEYLSGFSGSKASSSSKFLANIATRLNFSNTNDDSFLQSGSLFGHSLRTPDALKRKLMLTEAELQTSQAKLMERESMISVMEPANKKMCVSLENKLEQCKMQNRMDSQRIEELQGKLKWAQAETAHARSRILEIERQKKSEIEKWEQKMLAMQQELSNMKTEVAEIKSEKFETVRKLNIEVGRLELKVNMLSEDNDKNQEYIQTLKRQKNELTDKAAMSSALQKELNSALDRIKTLENKIEAEKDACLIVASRQSELKMLDEMEKENRVLKEEISKYRDTNIALYQEKLRTYQEKLMQAEKKSVAFAKIQMENEKLKEKLSQWEGLFEDKSTSFKSPTAFSIRLAQYQKNEVSLTNKISQLSNHCVTLEKQKNELEDTVQSLNKQLQHFKLSSPDLDCRMKRLQRRVMFLTKERDNYQKLLDSYLNECTMPGVSAHAEHISNLEAINMRYKTALEKTEKEVDALNERIKVLAEGNKTDVLLDKVKALQEEKSSLTTQMADLKREKEQLEKKISEKSTVVTPDENKDNWGGKVLHLRFNPLDNANKKYLETFEKLQEENDKLKKRIKVLEEEGAAAIDVTLKVQQKLLQEGSDSALKSLQDQLVAAERQRDFILESARVKSTEFREAVYRLTGYRIDVPTAEKYKLSHLYAESRDDFLLFQINSDGIQVIETDYSSQLLDKMELYLHQFDSFPAFLASLTLDLFNQQTYMAL